MIDVGNAKTAISRLNLCSFWASLGKQFSKALFLGHLVNEVGALVLVDPLGDPFGLDLARVGQRLWVSRVRQAQVGVMG